MRVLFISNDLLAGGLAYVLKKQGCTVKLFIKSKQQKENLTNLVPKINDWHDHLKWVGKDGLIVFDDSGFGEEQDKLRKEGYSVFGGNELGDKLEQDRAWAQSIFRKYGLQALPTYDFFNINHAVDFVRDHSGPWVIKQNGSDSKSLNYIGQLENGFDVISVLHNYARNHKKIGKITLQKRVVGVEIGIGRFFNGTDWVGPIEMNIEHKKLFPGEIGPTTGEMGTIAWYDNDESNVLFVKTLQKIKPFLQEIDYRGDIDIGCIVNKDGIFPLEATPRFGSPIIHLQSNLHVSPWFDFLKAIADGKPYSLDWKKGFGIVFVVATPPFPFSKKISGISSYKNHIHFSDQVTDEDFGSSIHFEEVSYDKRADSYYISDHRGYILYVTAVEKTISEASQKALHTLKQIHIPKMFYRNDIGLKFESEDLQKLIKWGYINKNLGN